MRRAPLWLSLLAIPFALVGLLFTGFAWFVLTLPDISGLEGCIVTSMHKVSLCSSARLYRPLSQISPHLRNAIIASEDASFFHHQGFDFHEIRKSMSQNFRSRGFARGASTITQQLAKNAFLSSEKTLLRKLREAALTIELERRYSKNFILEKYLNVVEFGPRVFGAQAAAQTYFSKSAAELSLLESVYLAFLLPNPKKYSESFRAGRLTPFARKMISSIIRRLEKFGKVTPELAASSIDRLDQFPWRDQGPESAPMDNSAAESPWQSTVRDQDGDSSLWNDAPADLSEGESNHGRGEDQDDSRSEKDL